MPHFIPRKIRIRKTSTKSGHEISLPPDWVRYHKLDEGEDKVELLYDSIIVLVPPNMEVDSEKLAKAVKPKKKEEFEKE